MSTSQIPPNLDLASLLNHLEFSVFVKDAQGRYVFVNDVACNELGVDRANLLGKTDFEIFPPVLAERIREQDDEIRRGASVEPREDTRMVNGQKRGFLVRKVGLAVADATEPYVLGYSIDISPLQHAQSALVAEQKFINQVLDTAPNLIFVKDAQGNVVLVNQAFADLYGKSKAALMQRNNAEFHRHAGEVSGYSRDDAKVIETWEPIRREETHTLDSGEVLWFDTIKTPLVRRDGTVQVLGISTDITARKRAEQLNLESEAQIRALLDAIPDHLLVLDKNGHCIRSRPDGSRHGAERFRVPTGQRVQDVLPADLATAMIDAFTRIQSGESLVSFEHAWTTEDEMRSDYEVRCTGLPDGSAMFLIRDITERKEMERLKDEFISVVSHELRTPLSALSGSLKLLASGIVGELADGPREMVDIALEGSDRLARLVNDILDIDKIERGRMEIELERVRLYSVITKSITESEALAHKMGLTLRIAAVAFDVYARANEYWLRQILGNLLSNAIKFSPHGTAIEIEVFDGPWVRIEVRDEGPGISAQFKHRLFQKFAQADASNIRRVGGTGLGLSICKAVVEQMGGRIGQLNRPAKGSTFFVEFTRDDDGVIAEVTP